MEPVGFDAFPIILYMQQDQSTVKRTVYKHNREY